MGCSKVFLCFLFVGLLFVGFVSAATDVSSLVYNQKAIIPKGSLAFDGSFGISTLSGSAVYSYPINIPKGINGLQPQVMLFYNHQNTKQSPGLVGAGWGLSQNYIERDVNYSFSDSSNDKFNLILNGASYNLVYNSTEGKYHTRTESFLDIIKINGAPSSYGEYWVVKTKDGTNYRLGYNNDSELVSNLHSYVVRWSLDLVNDNYNNSIFYSYNENPYANDNGTVYPDKIEYNNEKERKKC